MNVPERPLLCEPVPFQGLIGDRNGDDESYYLHEAVEADEPAGTDQDLSPRFESRDHASIVRYGRCVQLDARAY